MMQYRTEPDRVKRIDVDYAPGRGEKGLLAAHVMIGSLTICPYTVSNNDIQALTMKTNEIISQLRQYRQQERKTYGVLI